MGARNHNGVRTAIAGDHISAVLREREVSEGAAFVSTIFDLC